MGETDKSEGPGASDRPSPTDEKSPAKEPPPDTSWIKIRSYLLEPQPDPNDADIELPYHPEPPPAGGEYLHP